MTNPEISVNLQPLGRLTIKTPAYLAGFFGFFFSAFLCGSGGVLSIRRSTSSALDIGLSCFMAGA
jgi:hypothetical protein